MKSSVPVLSSFFFRLLSILNSRFCFFYFSPYNFFPSSSSSFFTPTNFYFTYIPTLHNDVQLQLPFPLWLWTVHQYVPPISYLSLIRPATNLFSPEPVFLFAIIVLTISTVFTTFILTGSTAPGLRKFYLISLRYNTDSNASKIIGSLDDLFSSDKGKVSFSNIRVGYRGLCIEHSQGWDCAKDGAALGHAAGDIGGDPLDLVAIADIYRNKISFSFPIWVAVIALAVGWLGVAVNCIPGIPIPAWTKKVAAAGCTLGSLALLGAMVLQQVTSYVSPSPHPHLYFPGAVLTRPTEVPSPPSSTRWA